MRILPIVIVASFFAAPAMAAESQSAAAAPPCVDVQIGNDRTAYLNCLNDSLQRRVEHERGTPQIAPPLDVHSSSNQIGTFNDAAARERMGNAFGVSSVPQRPARVFVSPIVPTQPR
jgi:hypothetical protein